MTDGRQPAPGFSTSLTDATPGGLARASLVLDRTCLIPSGLTSFRSAGKPARVGVFWPQAPDLLRCGQQVPLFGYKLCCRVAGIPAAARAVEWQPPHRDPCRPVNPPLQR